MTRAIEARRAVSGKVKVAVFCAALFAAAGAAWLIHMLPQQPPFPLLARAYSKYRTVDLRIPEADYGEMNTERGSRSGRPSELLNAELLIQRHLETHPDDPQWLHAQGLAALLDGRYEDAVSTLELARDLVAANSSEEAAVITDLATAYFERAVSLHRAIDYSLAIETLGHALELDPSSSVAHYNRAMVLQRSFIYPNAAEEWNRYLAAESTGPWAAEARRQLAFVEKRIQAADPSSGGQADLVELQSDQVMRSALVSNPLISNLGPEVAARTREENQDLWLTDALPFRNLPAAATLAGMVATRASFSADRYESELRDLQSISRTLTAEPLRVWLEYEKLFRITHSTRVATCMAQVGDLIETCRRRQYFWFLTRTLLERSACEVARGDFAKAEAMSREAIEVARQHSLPVARLRAAGFLTSYLAAAGQYRESAELAYESLALFWSRPMPYPRGQEFFHDMAFANEGLARWHTAKDAAEASAVMAQLSHVAMNEAINRARWAGFAVRLGLKQEASEEYALSTKLFDGMKSSPDVEQYRAFAESFAALAGDHTALSRFEPIVKASTNPFVIVSYLHTTALLAESAGQTTEARKRLEEAIEMVRKSSAPVRNVQEVLQWRDQLQSCYRDLTRILLLEKDFQGAYRNWQNFLRADEALQGFRAVPTAAAEGPAATVVTFARLGDRYGAWVRSAEKIDFSWISQNAATVDRLVRAYASLCSQPKTDWALVEKTGKHLRALLLDPTLQAPSESRIVLIQPDGELSRLPWASLLFAGGEPAGKQFFIAMLPTPIADSGLVRIPEIRVRHALIVAATLFHPSRRGEYLPLPGIEEEVAAVREAFPSANVLEGPAATAGGISAEIEKADALHFAGHAILTNGRVQLLVAPDASSEMGLWWPTGSGRWLLGLAVLSACSTGRYHDPEDPKPENLASAFLLDGTSEVVATLWNADSSATSYFMQSFYRNLRSNHTAVVAIAEAMEQTKRQAAWANPYYWASFSLFLRI